MNAANRKLKAQQGVALVTTVIVVAVLAVVAVAFMQSTTVDRFSSRSVANYYRAQLAAEAGAVAAGAMLASQTANDHFIVTANADRQLFAGVGTNQPAGTFAYRPLFSFTSVLSNLVTTNTNSANTVFSAGVPSTNLADGPNTTNFTFTNLPGGLSAASPPDISWVYMTNADGATNARFAFWVEDLGGRLDLAVVGTNTTAPEARRPTGTNPAEIALWSVFNSDAVSATNGVTNRASDNLVSARSNIFTMATARLVDASVTNSHLADLAANLRHDTNELQVIPFGFGYAQAGSLKTNLNTANLNSIATAINANLPEFSQRSGGLDGSRYIRAIAANAVDYIDSDSIPTTEGTAGGAGYIQGVDSYPLVNEVAVRYRLASVAGSSVVLSRQPFVELWNPTDRDFNGQVEVTVTCNDNIVGGLGASVSFSATSTTNIANASVPAGSFRAFALPAGEVTVPYGGPIPSNGRIGWAATNDGGGFNLRVGGVLVQSNLGSFQRRSASGSIGVASDVLPAENSAHVIVRGQRATATATANVRLTGDPRAHVYRSGLRAADRTGADYTWPTYSLGSHYGVESSFGGRNPLNSYASLLEPLRDTPVGSSPSGSPVQRIQALPTAVTPVSPDTNNVLQRIRNAPMRSAVELGRLFDPGLWNLTGTVGEVATNATAHPSRGGGFSLRIGQTEHPKFDVDGQRASQLLDLFAASELPPGPGGAVRSGVAGRINVNTATTNVLRALAAGVQNTADTGLAPGGTNFVVPVAAVTEFVDAMVAERNRRPFYSTAQLSGLTNTNGAGVFGNPNLLGVNNWNDAAAEEWFARLYELSTVRSRNFLVHVVGQAVRTNAPTEALSTSRVAFQLYLEPQRGADGLATNTVARVTQSWEL